MDRVAHVVYLLTVIFISQRQIGILSRSSHVSRNGDNVLGKHTAALPAAATTTARSVDLSAMSVVGFDIGVSVFGARFCG